MYCFKSVVHISQRSIKCKARRRVTVFVCVRRPAPSTDRTAQSFLDRSMPPRSHMPTDRIDQMARTLDRRGHRGSIIDAHCLVGCVLCGCRVLVWPPWIWPPPLSYAPRPLWVGEWANEQGRWTHSRLAALCIFVWIQRTGSESVNCDLRPAGSCSCVCASWASDGGAIRRSRHG